jgi:hypothetical protein
MTRRVLNLLTAVVAAAGLLLSIAVHLSTFLGADPQELSRLWLLHAGAIALGIPAIMIAKRTHGEPPDGSFAALFPRAPRWMIVALVGVLAYAAVNVVIQLRGAPFSGGPTRLADGSFALTDKGRFVRPISEADYHRYRAYEARVFSAWWVAFYGIWVTLLVSAVRREGAADRESNQTAPTVRGRPNGSWTVF